MGAVRLVFGAVAGALVVRREDEPEAHGAAIGAVVGALGALAGSWVGTRWRSWAAARLNGDLPGAMTEDLTAAGLAAMAVA